MIALLVIAVASFVLFRLLGGAPRLRVRRNHPAQAAATKIQELTEYAGRLETTKKYTGAEKVYLQILKIDHRHVPTYTRLAALYTAQQNVTDAIECFQIATQLSPSGETFYNLGLAYYNNQNPMKAVASFEKAIMFEPSVPHYIGLAKAFNRLHDGDRVVSTLEQAVAFEPSPKVLWLLADAYTAAGRTEELPAIYERIKELDPRDKRLRTLRAAAKASGRHRPAKLDKTAS
jgi:tetratricopeptide (TPR) repeat protein